MKLTWKQFSILSELQSFITQNGYSPTVRELSKQCGIRSVSSMHVHLQKLRQHKKIEWVPKATRTLRVIEE